MVALRLSSVGLACRVALLAAACGGFVVPWGGCVDKPTLPTSRPSQPRIVVLAPAAAEALASLNLQDRVVGISAFVRWPPGLARLPQVGSFVRPNLERVLELGATHVVTSGSVAGAQALQRLEALGMTAVALDMSTYDGALAGIITLGNLFDRTAAALQIVAGIGDDIERLRRMSAGLPERRVLVVVGAQPLYVAGKGSHIDVLLQAVGGRNVASDTATPYGILSLEHVVAQQPEIIVDTTDNRAVPLRGQALGAWARWPSLPAVAQDRVYFVDPSRLCVPGPRLGAMAELLAHLIHPERFGSVEEAALGRLGSGDVP